MEFFKNNEEVIDLVLTPKGRELLAKGNFKPYSYSFHDIDVRYENGDNESQNNIVTRIKATPRLKAPSFYKSGGPKGEVGFYRDGKTGNVIRRHILANKISDKSMGDQYAPAWKLKFTNVSDFQNYVFQNNIITSQYYNINLTANTFGNIIENEGLEELIPQLNINFYYKIVNVINYVDTPGGTKYIKTFLVEDSDVLLEIDEINSYEENDDKNFILEVFIEDTIDGNLVQLEFDKKNKDILSIEKYLGILFDNAADFEQQLKVADIYGPGGRDTPTSCE